MRMGILALSWGFLTIYPNMNRIEGFEDMKEAIKSLNGIYETGGISE